jgi:16S rRNA processing protein RimM
MENLVKIGYTQKPHGLAGELKVFIEEDYEDDFERCDTVFLNVKGKNLPYFIESIRGGNFLIVKFEDVTSKEAATAIQSKELSVRATDISRKTIRAIEQKSEIKNLVGYMIIDKTLGEIAVIEEIIEMPQQEMYVVTYKKREVLIPASEDYVVEVFEDKKQVVMDLPDGLLDL